MLLINWSENCVTSNAAASQRITYAVIDTKLHVPTVALSTDDRGKLSKTTTQCANQYIDYLNNPSFWGVNRLFVLASRALEIIFQK